MSRIYETRFYSVADAKARFSEMLNGVSKADTVITKNGMPKAVLIDYEKYVKISKILDEIYDLYLLDLGNVSEFYETRSREIPNDEEIQEV